MKLFQVKLRRIFYLAFGMLFGISSIAGIFMIFFSWLPPDSLGSVIGVSILSIIVCLILFFLMLMLENKIDENGYSSFLFGYFQMAKRNKFVYHGGLGYFVCIIQKNRIAVHDQKLFYSKYIADVENRGSYEKIALRIKNQIDDEYRIRVDDIEEKKRIRRQLDEVAKWDGFLDTESSREEKIKKVIK